MVVPADDRLKRVSEVAEVSDFVCCYSFRIKIPERNSS